MFPLLDLGDPRVHVSRCEKVYKLGRDQLVRERGSHAVGGEIFVFFFWDMGQEGYVRDP